MSAKGKSPIKTKRSHHDAFIQEDEDEDEEEEGQDRFLADGDIPVTPKKQRKQQTITTLLHNFCEDATSLKADELRTILYNHQNQLNLTNTEITRMRKQQLCNNVQKVIDQNQKNKKTTTSAEEYKGKIKTITWDNINQLDDIPEHFKDPITYNIMTDPVIVADGTIYDRSSIYQAIHNSNSGEWISPLTGEFITSDVIPVRLIRNEIDEWLLKTLGVTLDEVIPKTQSTLMPEWSECMMDKYIIDHTKRIMSNSTMVGLFSNPQEAFTTMMDNAVKFPNQYIIICVKVHIYLDDDDDDEDEENKHVAVPVNLIAYSVINHTQYGWHSVKYIPFVRSYFNDMMLDIVDNEKLKVKEGERLMDVAQNEWEGICDAWEEVIHHKRAIFDPGNIFTVHIQTKSDYRL